MRAIDILIVLALALLIGHSCAVETICPYPTPTPSTYPQGNFLLTKQLAGSTTGTFMGMESTGYSDSLSQNVYHNDIIGHGEIMFASELNMGPSLNSTKAFTFNGGNLASDEGYGQVSRSLTNLTWCDMVAGGSTTSLNQGNFASQLFLNAPIDLSYQVAMDGEPGYSTGFGSVYLRALSMEGTNSTKIDTQTLSQFYQWSGDFTFGVSDNLRITHPISRNYNTIVANLNKTLLC